MTTLLQDDLEIVLSSRVVKYTCGEVVDAMRVPAGMDVPSVPEHSMLYFVRAPSSRIVPPN